MVWMYNVKKNEFNRDRGVNKPSQLASRTAGLDFFKVGFSSPELRRLGFSPS